MGQPKTKTILTAPPSTIMSPNQVVNHQQLTVLQIGNSPKSQNLGQSPMQIRTAPANNPAKMQFQGLVPINCNLIKNNHPFKI